MILLGDVCTEYWKDVDRHKSCGWREEIFLWPHFSVVPNKRDVTAVTAIFGRIFSKCHAFIRLSILVNLTKQITIKRLYYSYYYNHTLIRYYKGTFGDMRLASNELPFSQAFKEPSLRIRLHFNFIRRLFRHRNVLKIHQNTKIFVELQRVKTVKTKVEKIRQNSTRQTFQNKSWKNSSKHNASK